MSVPPLSAVVPRIGIGLGAIGLATVGAVAPASAAVGTPSAVVIPRVVVTPSAVVTPTPVAAPTPVHVGNPYLAVAKGYVDPQWSANANSVAGGARVAGNPTGVWIERIADIAGVPDRRMGLRDHLDTALAQGAGYIQLVLNDIPGRDCALPSAGWHHSGSDSARYRADFIDPIAAIESDPLYRGLRIVNVIEPKALVSLILNTGSRGSATAQCQEVLASGSYVSDIRYAMDKLHAAGGNVYNYLDAASHGSIGWSDNFQAAAKLFATTVKGTAAGFASVDGFIVNLADYGALVEPYFGVETRVGTAPVRQSKWVDWNDYVDESSFAARLRTRLVSEGFDPGIGMLMDTSRNGWGGPKRPTRASSSVAVDTFVDESRIDRRLAANYSCNQVGSGLGERPQAAPVEGVDAYVWMKRPGESDGSSTLIANDEGIGFDQMCDPNFEPLYSGRFRGTGALPNAPMRGSWFPAMFAQLMANAYPPLS